MLCFQFKCSAAQRSYW